MNLSKSNIPLQLSQSRNLIAQKKIEVAQPLNEKGEELEDIWE